MPNQKNTSFIKNLENKSAHKPLLITTGEPSGIGMDIVLDIYANHACEDAFFPYFVITACLTSLKLRASQLMHAGVLKKLPNFIQLSAQSIKSNDLYQHSLAEGLMVIDTPVAHPVVAGQLTPINAPMVEQQLSIAHQLAHQGWVSAIVTAPIAKSVMIEGGIGLSDGSLFSGHTEYFMQKCNLDKVVMMLANQTMKVALVTTHLPLKEVPNAITASALTDTIQITHQALSTQFGIKNPCLLVCGLNPHAGENGHLGTEEQDIINPTLKVLQEQGINTSLALPADTLFTCPYLELADAVIAMYHDQGLAPLKSHGFGETVNITLGLPYIRTSVDHGTALDLAGSGKANSSSLKHAILLAWQMSNKAKQPA